MFINKPNKDMKGLYAENYKMLLGATKNATEWRSIYLVCGSEGSNTVVSILFKLIKPHLKPQVDFCRS